MPQSGRPGASSGYCQSLDGIAPITQLPAGIIMQRALMVLSCIIGGVFMFIALGATDTFDMSKFDAIYFCYTQVGQSYEKQRCTSSYEFHHSAKSARLPNSLPLLKRFSLV